MRWCRFVEQVTRQRSSRSAQPRGRSDCPIPRGSRVRAAVGAARRGSRRRPARGARRRRHGAAPAASPARPGTASLAEDLGSPSAGCRAHGTCSSRRQVPGTAAEADRELAAYVPLRSSRRRRVRQLRGSVRLRAFRLPRQRWTHPLAAWRALLAVSIVLLPVAPLELADNGVDRPCT